MSGGSSGGSPPLRRKIVVLGFRGIGKTAVTTHFVEGRFTEKYDPTIEGNYEHRVKISNAVFDVQIIDTAGMVRAATESVRNQQGTHTEGTHTEDRLRGHAVPCIGAAHGRFRAQTKPHDPHTAPRGLQNSNSKRKLNYLGMHLLDLSNNKIPDLLGSKLVSARRAWTSSASHPIAPSNWCARVALAGRGGQDRPCRPRLPTELPRPARLQGRPQPVHPGAERPHRLPG